MTAHDFSVARFALSLRLRVNAFVLIVFQLPVKRNFWEIAALIRTIHPLVTAAGPAAGSLPQDSPGRRILDRGSQDAHSVE